MHARIVGAQEQAACPFCIRQRTGQNRDASALLPSQRIGVQDAQIGCVRFNGKHLALRTHLLGHENRVVAHVGPNVQYTVTTFDQCQHGVGFAWLKYPVRHDPERVGIIDQHGLLVEQCGCLHGLFQAMCSAFRIANCLLANSCAYTVNKDN